ncbi:MAG TPA: DUF3987 domain-containing protein [Terriglobales bacterium]|nr:DUF3987 domain-containing protein [Terriglobales bacterium]
MQPSQPTAAELFAPDAYYGPKMTLRMRQQRAEAEQALAPDPAGDWPALVPIGGTPPPVKPMLPGLLPEALRPLCLDIAERMQVPLDFPAAATVLCLAGAVNRRAAIQPKAQDTGWVVVPNLWGGIVAKPGFLKSPVLQAITRPLAGIAEAWRTEYDAATQSHAMEEQEAELRLEAWKQQFKQAHKKSGGAPPRPEPAPDVPVERRLIVHDATFEKLHENPGSQPRRGAGGSGRTHRLAGATGPHRARRRTGFLPRSLERRQLPRY